MRYKEDVEMEKWKVDCRVSDKSLEAEGGHHSKFLIILVCKHAKHAGKEVSVIHLLVRSYHRSIPNALVTLKQSPPLLYLARQIRIYCIFLWFSADDGPVTSYYAWGQLMREDWNYLISSKLYERRLQLRSFQCPIDPGFFA